MRQKKIEEGSTKSHRRLEDSQASMGMGATRILERILVSTGKIEAADSRFETSLDIPNSGVLWDLPVQIANGLLRHI